MNLDFSTSNYVRRVWSQGPCNLNSRVLFVSSWAPDFDPYTMKQTNAQCWFRFYKHCKEDLRPKIHFEIDGFLGILIALEAAILNRSFGHFARILIEINFSARFQEQILVEKCDLFY